MTIREKIEEDIRQSMRSQNRQRLDALRFLKNAIQMVEKDQQKELDDTGVTEVIAKQVRERRESIRMFEQGSRTDLVAKETAELAVLEEYMPPQMSAEQLSTLIREVIEQVGAETPRDKGRVMGRLMPQVRGLADGAQVNALVDEILGSG
ncbi:MAG: GatB/YqeY domain-containing protein [Stenotrophomonas maltophilia]